MTDSKFEIVRSFSLKKSLPNYQNFDGFCSMKQAFKERPSKAEIARISKELYGMCEAQVFSAMINTFAKIGNQRSEKQERKENAELEFMGGLDPRNEDRA